MDNDWQCVYTTNQPHRIEIAKAILKENAIEAVTVDKRDSSYITVGEIELYVKREDVILAQIIINRHNL
jgi:hypothetical protein